VARAGMDILTKLADAGEEAIAKLTEAPGADRMLGTVTSMRDRLDEIQKRLRGLEALEQRVAELERRVDAVAPAKATGTSRSTAAKRASTSAAKPKPASKAKPSDSSAAKGTTSKSSTRPTGSGSPG
jgi:hypothetical protein